MEKGFTGVKWYLPYNESAGEAGLRHNEALAKAVREAIEEYVSRIEAVTVDEVFAAAQTYMDAEQPIIVVVGDAAIIQPQLEALGDVVVVDANGEIVE